MCLPRGHGRFFAAMEIKAILAYLVENYDMELEGGLARPKDVHITFAVLSSREAVVTFKKRQVV